MRVSVPCVVLLIVAIAEGGGSFQSTGDSSADSPASGSSPSVTVSSGDASTDLPQTSEGSVSQSANSV